MKKEEIDRLITESLSQEEAEFYNTLEGDTGLLRSISGLYKGNLAWMAVVMTMVHLVVAVVAFYSGYQLFTSGTVEEMITYGAVMFIALLFASMIKLWTWMQMNRNAALNEIRRLEYQIAVLIEKRNS
ncbi:MAG: DUF6768 family protein [Balneolaceae bacterium]